jgi:hypothetical protein
MVVVFFIKLNFNIFIYEYNKININFKMKRIHLNESDIQNIIKNIVKKIHGKQPLNEDKGNIYLNKLISEAIDSIADTNNVDNIMNAIVDVYYKVKVFDNMYLDYINCVDDGVLSFTVDGSEYAEILNTDIQNLPYPFNKDTEITVEIGFDYKVDIDEPEPEVGYNGGYDIQCTKIYGVKITFSDGSEPINLNCTNNKCGMLYGLVNSFLDEDKVSEYIYELYNNYEPDYEND